MTGFGAFADDSCIGPRLSTYTRDSYTGLDYADQRFYASVYGRFNTPDPYQASGGPADPSSWNRYSYVGGDPVNFSDPRGLLKQAPDPDGGPDTDPFYDGSNEGNEWDEYYYTTTQATQQQKSTLNIRNLSTTSTAAVSVQNSLRWIQSQISAYSDCDSWMTGNSQVISTVLGESAYSTTDLVGVGNFSSPGVNAVAGTVGTNLPDGSAALTINLNGAYFNGTASVGDGITGINGGSDQAKLFILLHELGHLTGAQGFQDGDSGASKQTANNNLLMQHCADFIHSVSN